VSYDLFMTPRTGEIDRERFTAYFAGRPHYKAEGDQAWYQNEDTGTYFGFEYSTEAAQPLSFNINFIRPSYFAKEAEPEVNAVVRAFDLVVEDPQIDGMGTGEYSSDKFLAGWATGNAFGLKSIAGKQAAHTLHTLPAAEIERIWLWNLERHRRQAELGEAYFVPRIIFLEVEGMVRSAAVWPDALPCLIPRVEHLIIHRDQLAPRRLFRKQVDSLLLVWKDCEPIIRTHSDTGPRPGLLLRYQTAPPDVVQFISGLPSRSFELKGIPPDSVVDEELTRILH
jgi:hypothetical protein